ncbi:hypothetical protein, partial [Microbacterium sp. Bi128]|uniref:hypothetical protein n=1 Tax=Microbacterium sp. Bi128 TaxID=2821115 RepID=UPI001E4C5B35
MTTNVGLALSKEYADSEPAPLELGSPSDGFLLSVGRVNVRKNLERRVRSLVKNDLISTKRPLVIVGAPDGAQGST